MKKIIKVIFVFAVAIALGFTTVFTTSAETTTTAPESVKTGSAKLMDAYLGTITISYKKLSNGGVYYCTQFAKDTPKSGVKMTKVGPMDAGMTYIIKNGYPNKKFTGDNKKDFFITQLAVWWYQDIQTGSKSSVLTNLKAGKYNDTYIGKKIIELKDGALKANKAGYSKPSLTLNAKDVKFKLDNDNYVSNVISVTAKNLKDKYTVSLIGAPEGTYVVNEKDKKQVKFDKDEKFKVVVPSSKKAENINFSVKVTGISSVDKVYKYKSENSSVQNITLGKVYEEKKDMSSTAKFNIKAEKKVEDPKLPEQDKTEEKVEETTEEKVEETTEEVTTEEIVVITEVITEQQVFEDVVEEEIYVPDTASATSIVTYILGAIISIIGLGLVIKNEKKA